MRRAFAVTAATFVAFATTFAPNFAAAALSAALPSTRVHLPVRVY